jgi:hypothetical protein
VRNRNQLTRRSAMAGAAALAPMAALGASASPTRDAGRDAFWFFEADDLNFEALFAIGEAAYGPGEAGEVLATINAINTAGASYQSFCDAFVALAGRLASFAAAVLAAGDSVSARSAYLRAAQYYNQALFFVLGTRTPDKEAELYRLMQTQWATACRLFSPPIEPVEIPYEGGSMPGYFLKGGDGKRPTLIVMNGSDAQNVDTFAFGGAAAQERGWNALLFEGPGQGSMLFERKIPFRPDWEKVVTPVVDYLIARPEVDPTRVALSGWSFGGSLVTRAAAFEPRLAAICADPGFLSIWDAWPEPLRKLVASGDRKRVNAVWSERIVPGMNAAQRFTVAKRAEIFGESYLEDARAGRIFSDLWGFAETLKGYDITAMAPKVKAPMLITQYARDEFMPGGGQALYAILTCPKTLRVFTVAEGAAEHCAPLAPQLRNSVVLDWLAATLDIHEQTRPSGQ